MFTPESLTALTIGIYFFASAIGIADLIYRRAFLRHAGLALCLGAFACQTLILIFGFHKLFPSGPSLGAYLQLIAWFLLLGGIVAWLKFRMDAILFFACPLALLLFLVSAPLINLAHALPETLSTPFYALHIGSLFLALGILSLAFMGSLIFLLSEKRIKNKKNMGGIWKNLPALAILDKINSFAALACFPLYSLGLITGIFWAGPIYGNIPVTDPKQIVSLFIWLLLCWLFYKRVAGSWKGKKPACLIIAIFLLSFFSIIIINLFLPTSHGFIRP